MQRRVDSWVPVADTLHWKLFVVVEALRACGIVHEKSLTTAEVDHFGRTYSITRRPITFNDAHAAAMKKFKEEGRNLARDLIEWLYIRDHPHSQQAQAGALP